MDVFHFISGQVVLLPTFPAEIPKEGFLWLDATHDEVAADSAAWRDAVRLSTGVRLYDPHLSDATNLSHPSYFDPTQLYAMLVFRKLVLDDTNGNGNGDTEDAAKKRKVPTALTRLTTNPVTFLLMDHALVTVRATRSRTLQTFRNRLLEHATRTENAVNNNRLPASSAELMLRLLNALVDQYLALREPLTNQIDRWQRSLLNPRSRFNNWTALLDARLELRKLDQLCEGQRDAVQELRDYLVDAMSGMEKSHSKELLLVRANDVMEHITRVLTHTQRLEAAIESTVQIHFSAMSHRTSEVMRILTVITALFMPLTLITGVFGMNFEVMPLLQNAMGFWITMAMMGLVVCVLLILFWRKRYLDDQIVDHDR